MSDKNKEHEKDTSRETEIADSRDLDEKGTGDEEAVTEVEEEETDEVDEFDEMDEVEEAEEEGPPPEKGASLVIGQGDFSMAQSNRGADDPGDNTLAEPQSVCRFGDYVVVSDRGNHRVLIWEQIPEENGDPATLVLGQEDFADCLENRGMTTTLDEMTSGLGDESLDGFTISKCEEDTLSQPAGVCVIDGKLYVVDSGNHRALRWSGIPSEDGEAPSLVLGQDNFDCNEANRRGLVGSGSLFFPMGIHSGDDQHVFIADKDNHRVLIWNKSPFQNGWNADICLGQAGMDEREPNRGEFDNVGPDTLSFPTAVFYDIERDKLLVVDQGNNRILVWHGLPRESGRPADVVIGQKDFYSREPNAGLGFRRASAVGLYFPTEVVCGKIGLFVSDTGNHRVLYWKDIPTENGQPADLVLGQLDFQSNRPNRGGEATGATFNDPFGLFLEEEETGDEEQGPASYEFLDEKYDDDDEDEAQPETQAEEEESRKEEEEGPPIKFKLYVADRSNARVAIWDELPKPPKSEDEEDEGDLEIDSPNTLMGEDEDEDDLFGEEEEEGEEEPPKEVPSA